MDGMPWFTNEERVQRSARPSELLTGARSIISLAMSYYTGEFPEEEATEPRGKIGRYAWGDDYHKIMKDRLWLFVEGLSERVGRPVRARIFVDDGPILDRAVAQRAGVGWFGKNTNILTTRHGSWVFLAEVVTDLELSPDIPLRKTCGQCVRCIDACPTGAIIAPYVLDATRCISYLTIECRGPIPRQLRPLVGDWVFGCDICQEVCPVNIKALPNSSEPAFQQHHDFAAPALIPLLSLTEEEFRERFRNSRIKRAKRGGLQRNVCVALGNIGDRVAVPALIPLLSLTEEEFRERFRNSRIKRAKRGGLQRNVCVALGNIGDRVAVPALIPLLSLTEEEFRERFRNSRIKRAKRGGLQRNVCVALGNIGDRVAVPALVKALKEAEPLVTIHAAWVLGRLGGQEVRKALEWALVTDDDGEVREEARLALEELRVPVPAGS